MERTHRAGARDRPDVQRAGESRVDRRAGCARRCRTPTCSSPTTTAPTAPARSPTSWPPRTPHVHVLHRPGKAGPRRGLHRRVPLGRWSGATTCSSRWTPTARTSRRSCPGCSTRARRGADLVIGSRWVPRREGASTGRSRASCCPAAATSTSGCCSASRVRDTTGGYRAYRADDAAKIGLRRRRSRRATASRSTSRCGPSGAGLPGDRGADHLRRARARRQQDERRHHDGGALAGHRLGRPGHRSAATPSAMTGGCGTTGRLRGVEPLNVRLPRD